MLVSAIVAVSENGVIGRDGHLPWRLSDDLKRFRSITTGHSVVLGRKNYDDIGRPLPNRTNYVLTRNPALEAPGCVVCDSLGRALGVAEKTGESECFIIGGAAIYKEAMPLVKKLYVTRVLAQVPGMFSSRIGAKDGAWSARNGIRRMTAMNILLHSRYGKGTHFPNRALATASIMHMESAKP